MPLVSIITPMFNAQRYLEETVRSVQAQTMTDWEMILVNDCSTDGTLPLANKLSSEDSRIRVQSNQQNSGQAISRREGSLAALGRYICYLDADDLWHPNKLEKQLKFMTNADLALSYTAYEHIDGMGHSLNKVIPAVNGLTYKKLLRFNQIGCLTIMYDRDKTGLLWVEPVMRENDYLLWLNVLKRGLSTAGLNEVLAYYRTGHASVSKNKVKVSKYYWGIIRHREKLPLLIAGFYFLRYAVLGVLKHYF